MIGDPDEGTLVLTEEIFDFTVNTREAATLTRQVFGNPSPNKIIGQNKIIAPRETRNLWLYCTSRSLQSLARVQEWEPTYNACAVIHRPEDFMLLIANGLEKRQRPLRSIGIYPVMYRVREYPYAEHDGTDPALIKDPFFSSQNEVRYAFDPIQIPRELGILLHIPDLVACCRILQDDEIPR